MHPDGKHFLWVHSNDSRLLSRGTIHHESVLGESRVPACEFSDFRSDAGAFRLSLTAFGMTPRYFRDTVTECISRSPSIRLSITIIGAIGIVNFNGKQAMAVRFHLEAIFDFFSFHQKSSEGEKIDHFSEIHFDLCG